MPDLYLIEPSYYSLQQRYLFQVTHTPYTTKILMFCKNSIINTEDLPTIYEDLNKFFPSVLSTKCFNDKNLPFDIEVRKTEIAHLFEHILIEYIFQKKFEKGEKNIKVKGLTEWNWMNEPYGTYNLLINVGKNEKDVFDYAFNQTILLFEELTCRSLQNEKQTAAVNHLSF